MASAKTDCNKVGEKRNETKTTQKNLAAVLKEQVFEFWVSRRTETARESLWVELPWLQYLSSMKLQVLSSSPASNSCSGISCSLSTWKVKAEMSEDQVTI